MNQNLARVGIIMPGWVPARIPFLNQLATTTHIQPVVFLMNRVQVGRTEAILPFENVLFEYKILSSLTLRYQTKAGDIWPIHINPALHWHIAQGNFAAVVALQWTALYTPMTLLQMKMQSKPILLWEESISRPPRKLKKALLPIIKKGFGTFDACIAASSRCKEYLVEMGAKPEGVFISGTPIDNDFFRSRSLSMSKEEKTSLKKELGFDGLRIVLSVGQLIPRKGTMILLQAFAKLRSIHHDVGLLLLGSGILLNEITEFISYHNLGNSIQVLGYIQQDELPKYLTISDVFVLPSLYDAFPVAIHEAMACGLPVITTNMVGATPDLVRDGVNGFVVPPADPDALWNALYEILRDENTRRQMAEASLEIMAEWTIDKAVIGFRRAIEYSLDSKKKQN